MFLHAITAVAPAASTAGHWMWDRSQSAVSKALRIVGKTSSVKPASSVSHRLIRIPGLIGVNVYLCDFDPATSAALSGGITALLVMPDTKPPITDKTSLFLVNEVAKKQARCDFGVLMGASQSNYDEIPDLTPHVVALKMYLSEAFTTDLKLDGIQDWLKHFENWPKDVPICVHAEGRTTAAVILLASLHNRPVHVCHVTTKEEIEVVKAAKQRGLNITCEVCPYHLLLTEKDTIGDINLRLPTPEDQKALWDNLDVIDCFATNHGYTQGYVGLETMLPLLLTAVSQEKLSLQDVVNRCYYNPKRIFKLPDQADTFVEIDLEEEWVLPVSQNKSIKSPFSGQRFKGAVKRVVLRGETAFDNGLVTAPLGYGFNVREVTERAPLSTEHFESSEVNESRTTRLRTKSEQSSRVGTEISFQRHTSETRELGSVIGPSKPRALSVGPSAFTKEPQQHSPEPVYRAVSPGPSRLFSSLSQQPKSVTVRPLQSANAAPQPSPSVPPAHGLHGQSVLTVETFTKEQLNAIFNLAQTFRLCVQKERSLDHILRGKLLACAFYEESTIARSSFSAAIQRLGGRVVYVDELTSSARKGETVQDAITVLSSYSDVVVFRHPETGVATRISSRSSCPLINAGDGVGEHPTQAISDIFTIREEIGTLTGLTVTMVGDLKHGRTVHSLAKLLTLFNVQLRYVSLPNLGMPEDIVSYVASKGISQMQYSSLEETLPDTDVLYMTRIQHERFTTQEEYEMACGHFIVTPQLLRLAKRRMIIMHPLPRLFEIPSEVDSDPRAAYFRQAEAGLYVKMALLAMVLGKC